MAVITAKTQPKVKPVCNICDNEIIVDAWAEWDSETQQWELQTTLDSGWCNTCDSNGNGDIKYRYSWKEIADRENQ